MRFSESTSLESPEMSLSLHTERRGYGIRLTFPQSVYPTDGENKFAGEINVIPSPKIRWRFKAPDGTQGPVRTKLTAAEYDALAYWSENHIKEG